MISDICSCTSKRYCPCRFPTRRLMFFWESPIPKTDRKGTSCSTFLHTIQLIHRFTFRYSTYIRSLYFCTNSNDFVTIYRHNYKHLLKQWCFTIARSLSAQRQRTQHARHSLQLKVSEIVMEFLLLLWLIGFVVSFLLKCNVGFYIQRREHRLTLRWSFLICKSCRLSCSNPHS